MFSLLAAAALAAPFQAGAAVGLGEVNLTPPEPLSLGGYSERGDLLGMPGRRPLRARFIAVQAGGKTLLIGAAEMLTMPEGLIESVRSKLPAEIDLVLAATHTHNAPDSQRLNPRMTFKIPGISPYASRWQDWYTDKLAEGAHAALAAAPIASQALKIRRASTAANRARRKGLPPDPYATLFTFGEQGLIGAYAAHPTLHEPNELDVSGDWPGAWTDSGPWIALTGAIGSASPVAEGASGEERSQNLAAKLNSALASAPPAVTIAAEPKWTFSTIKLPNPTPHPTFAAANKIPDALASMAVSKFAPTEGSLFLLSWGGWLVVGVPGEPTEDVALRLRQTALLRGFSRTLVLSHVNGWGGYMLSPDDYDRGGYEATLSFYGRNLTSLLCESLDRGCRTLAPPIAYPDKVSGPPGV